MFWREKDYKYYINFSVIICKFCVKKVCMIEFILNNKEDSFYLYIY